MNDQPHNPPAFPHDNQELGDRHRIAQPGMTLRDYFAGQALAGLMASPTTDPESTAIALANDAYLVADAMLKARKDNQ